MSYTVGDFIAFPVAEVGDPPCRVFWGSHGCRLDRGHEGPHTCCCDCPDHEANRGHRTDDEGDGVTDWVCVGAPPYYGPDTRFTGEDA